MKYNSVEEWKAEATRPIWSGYAQVAFPLPYVRSRRVRAGLQGRRGKISELRLSGVSGAGIPARARR